MGERSSQEPPEMCDIDINIAVNGEASQSSDYKKYVANRAIDGSNEINLYNDSCAHTLHDLEPWWRLDLKESYSIGTIVISGRSDCCLERLSGAQIRIGNSPDNNNPVCSTITNVSVPTTTYCCNGMEGQYISVVIPRRYEYLTLCEVKVHKDPSIKLCW
ncbi:pentraxin fusion protein-like [Pyxicephalus adspersus]|uniref:pentraxin fusion protein-like n=1 Tax=Pyxicephalus adspersus TaxID=30357 RepID=UPI003B5AB50F